VSCDIGHTECLAFALKHGCQVTDWVLRSAVMEGHPACVELLADQGLLQELLQEPLLHAEYCCSHIFSSSGVDSASVRGPFTPDQVRCIRHVVDKGGPVHPGTLIMAVRSGDVDFVRYLHGAGVPLWECAWEEEGEDGKLVAMDCACGGCDLYDSARNEIVPIPREPKDAAHMLKALRYGWAMGAALTPTMERVLEDQRRSTRAVLLCFHAATRLSRGAGNVEQGIAWAVMGAIPIELIEKMLVLADLEIPESLHCTLPRERSVMEPAMWPWLRSQGNCDMWGYFPPAFVTSSNPKGA
jgi:hypothetical protein